MTEAADNQAADGAAGGTGAAAARDRAVAGTVARIRAIERDRGVTRAALDAIRAELLALAGRRDLFPAADFPPPPDAAGDRLYLLSIDADDRFALYLNRGADGKATPPHDHTTWAVVVGVAGTERNIFYRRTDDGRTPGHGTVEPVAEETVRPGTGVAMMPDDIHAIRMEGDGPKLHLHMYGLGLHRLDGRVMYDMEAGTYSHYPAHPDVVPAGANARPVPGARDAEDAGP